jgi:hypothetical protein
MRDLLLEDVILIFKQNDKAAEHYWLNWYQAINCPALRGRIYLEKIILNKENCPMFSHYAYFWLCTETSRNYRLLTVHLDDIFLSAIFSRLHLHTESLSNTLKSLLLFLSSVNFSKQNM